MVTYGVFNKLREHNLPVPHGAVGAGRGLSSGKCKPRVRSPALGRVRMRLAAQASHKQAFCNPRPHMSAIKAVGEFF